MKTFRCKLGLFPQCLAIWPLPVLWCPTSILVAYGQVFSTCLTYVQMIHVSMEVPSFDSIDSSTILSAVPYQTGHVVFVIWASTDLEWYFVCIVCSLSLGFCSFGCAHLNFTSSPSENTANTFQYVGLGWCSYHGKAFTQWICQNVNLLWELTPLAFIFLNIIYQALVSFTHRWLHRRWGGGHTC